MPQFVVANNVNTQLAAALPSSGAGSTTAVLASSANLPTLNTSIGQMMPLTLNDAATGAIYETVYVTAISGATLTVLRGQEGTSALNWNVGDYAFCGPTAGTAGLTTMRTQYQASAAYSTSQTLTATIAGESIGFTGTSAATFSVPAQSSLPPLTPTAVYNDGTAALTLTANGTDKFVTATGQVTSIVMQPGDDLSFYASTTAGLLTAASGSALRQYEPLVVGGATAPNHAVQLGQVGTLQSLTASVASNALTMTLNAPAPFSFRNPTLTSGIPVSAFVSSSLSLTVPSGATLGTAAGLSSRLIWLVAYNGGAPVLCVTNLSGGLNLDETTLISPTTISAGATMANVIYSSSAVAAGSPFRMVGFCDIMEATAGTWAAGPTTVQGIGGEVGIELALRGSPLFGASIGSAGYQKLPSGLIIQWGSGATDGSGNLSVTFPIAFPNTFTAIIPSSFNSGFGAPTYRLPTNTGVVLNVWGQSGSLASGAAMSWIAIGY